MKNGNGKGSTENKPKTQGVKGSGGSRLGQKRPNAPATSHSGGNVDDEIERSLAGSGSDIYYVTESYGSEPLKIKSKGDTYKK